MRHGKAGKKFNRTPSHRKAMFRNMVTSLLKHERIVTTEVKAKESGRLAEKMITLGKRGDLHARRQAVAFIRSNEVVKRVFSEYAQRYATREGGYTRVLKLDARSGDNAPMALVELVDRPIAEPKEKGQKTKEKTAKTAKPKKEAKAKKESKAQSAKPKEKEAEEKAEAKPKKKTPAKKAAAKEGEKADTQSEKKAPAKKKKEE
ncbi:MAG: 50S ribosomal protein L17 [bacterium]|nr:MAG: 50S ribosomal protein L17 [bacterium]